MPKGKPWTKKEVEKLRKLLEAKEPLEVIAAELRGTRDAVKKKCKRFSLEVVGAKGYRTTTSLKLPKELPSVEEALKILAGTLETLRMKWDLNPPWDLVPVLDLLRRIRDCRSLYFRQVPNVGAKDFVRVPCF